MNTRTATRALFLASLVAVAFDALRGNIFAGSGLGYLVWNLFLAWVPYLITAYLIKKDTPLARFVPLFVVWLLFFPNAAYMVTDIIHVGTRVHRTWNDSLLFFFFAWIALMLGILSLAKMHDYLKMRMSAFRAEIAVIAICLVSSFGIYLGRFERLNSWDVIVRPLDLLTHSYSVSTGLVHEGTPFVFVLMFTAFFYTVYSTMRILFAASASAA